MRNRLKSLDDSELVVLAKKGAHSAFEEIYDRHSSGIARVLASFVGPDRDLLDDLTQDVFFRVIKNLDSYAPSHPFRHWLYTIALNVGRNHARRQSKVISVNPFDLEDISDEQLQTAGESEEIFEKTLIRLAARLPINMREVLSLRIGSEMSYGEIAEVLGIPEGTARSRMHNAIRILREKSGVIARHKEERK